VPAGLTSCISVDMVLVLENSGCACLESKQPRGLGWSTKVQGQGQLMSSTRIKPKK